MSSDVEPPAKEIRCDSATLHAYTDTDTDGSRTAPTARCGRRPCRPVRIGALTDDPQLGERRYFGERDTLTFPSLGDQSMRLYAVLWKDNQPVTCTYPDWVHPGGVYEVDATMTVHVEGRFPGEEFYDYYDAPTVFCKWPGCGWQKKVSWGEQEAAFKVHFLAKAGHGARVTVNTTEGITFYNAAGEDVTPGRDRRNENPKPSIDLHHCELSSQSDGYGEAIEYVDEGPDGTLWAGNGEYGSQVNYCPVCGYPARVPVKSGRR